jgi:hypothetical protein
MGGYKHKDFLPYWSKVEKLTIHEKTDIEPSSPDPAKQPVSQIDCALSEGVIRKLSNAYNAMPTKASELDAFETAHASEPDRTAAHASVNEHRDFLIKLYQVRNGVAEAELAVDNAVCSAIAEYTKGHPEGSRP